MPKLRCKAISMVCACSRGELQVKNAELDIGGVLFYEREGRVAQQVLEGPPEAVRLLFERIKADPRHDVQWEQAWDVIGREFTDWTMLQVMTLQHPRR